MTALNLSSLDSVERQLQPNYTVNSGEWEGEGEKWRFHQRRHSKPEHTNHESMKVTGVDSFELDTTATLSSETKENYEELPPPPPHRFTCSYRYSPIRSKGAILVLVWNFLVFSSISGVYGILLKGIIDHVGFIPSDYAWSLTVASFAKVFLYITYPLAGWLADTYFGRYNTLFYSMIIIWIGSFAMAVCTAIIYSHPNDKSLEDAIYLGVCPVILLVMFIGVAGFQANVIPFGTDQMQGASSEQLSSFVLWYLWTEYFGFGIVYSYLLSCQLEYKFAVLSESFTIAFCMSVALSLNYLFRHVLDIEPARGDPFKTIYRVLKFAKNHKTPTNRSAFTYWEEKLPSRIDLAKRKYGGPFTTEQVEEVKTFFRIMVLFLTCICIENAYVAMITTTGQLSDHLKHSSSVDENSTQSDCFVSATIDNLRLHIIFVVIPLYHFLFQPFFRNYIPATLKRAAIGVCFALASLLTTLIIETIGYISLGSEDHTICLLTATNQTALKFDIDYHWVVIPNTLTGLAYLITSSALIEFVCAQAPYAMKGALIGLLYSQYGIANAIGFVILLSFYIPFNSNNPPQIVLGCGFWYYLTNLVISLIGVAVFVYVIRWYKPRKRNDLSFDPLHVEDYYEQHLSH